VISDLAPLSDPKLLLASQDGGSEVVARPFPSKISHEDEASEYSGSFRAVALTDEKHRPPESPLK
jgi:hypothetical protein